LAATAWLEQRMLAPHRVILASVRSRRARVEHVEAYVAREAERLLRELGDSDPIVRAPEPTEQEPGRAAG
jgi:hypothetical protein